MVDAAVTEVSSERISMGTEGCADVLFAGWSPPISLSDQSTGGPITASAFQGMIYLIYKDSQCSKIWVTTSEDGAFWSPASTIPDQYCQICASSAVFNNKLYLAYQQDGSEAILVTYLDSGTGQWAGAVEIPRQATSGPISLTVYQDSLYLIYGDNSSGPIWVTTSIDGASFSVAGTIPGQGCSAAASSTVGPDLDSSETLYLMYKDNDTSQLWITYLNNGVWSDASAISGQTTGGPVTLVNYQNTLVCVYGDSSTSDIWMTYPNGIDWSKGQIPNQSCYKDASAVVFNGDVYLIYADANRSGTMWTTFISQS